MKSAPKEYLELLNWNTSGCRSFNLLFALRQHPILVLRKHAILSNQEVVTDVIFFHFLSDIPIILLLHAIDQAPTSTGKQMLHSIIG